MLRNKLTMQAALPALVLILASCTSAGAGIPGRPASSVQVQDPARHDLTVFNRTVHDLRLNTTTTMVRVPRHATRRTLPETS